MPFHKQPQYGLKYHTSQPVKLISDLGFLCNTSLFEMLMTFSKVMVANDSKLNMLLLISPLGLITRYLIL